MRPRVSDPDRSGAPKPEAAEIRERIMTATLHVAGEVGYDNASVDLVLEQHGGFRAEFYRHFESIEDSYAQAYALESERIYEAMLAAGRDAGSWPDGLQVVLETLGKFISDHPMVARGLLIEVHVAGGPSLRKHQEIFERLSRAVDSARRKTLSCHAPPPLTASFIVHMVNTALTTALRSEAPDRFPSSELIELVCSYYNLAPTLDGGGERR
jgi:AcrR family transcriptional regulator